MASAEGLLGGPSPLKAPAIEVVDLSSETEATAEVKHDDNLEDQWTDEEDPEDQWSLYEDALQGMMDGDPSEVPGTDTFSPEESLNLRKRLRSVGEAQFLSETYEAGLITARKLCSAFGIQIPLFLLDQPDEDFLPLLGLGICRELQKRQKLPQYNTIEDAASLIEKSSNIIVLTGAGISTSLGIPDFRSKDTGLYSQLAHLGLSDPQEVFDISIFREDPSIFYSVAKDILPSTNKFSPTHAFIRLLQDKGKLLTNFTQNIDNIEGHAGISSERLIQCHGSFATASCVECHHKVPGHEIYKDLKAGRVARCDRCIRHLRQLNPAGIKRKRSFNALPRSKKKREDYEDSTDDEEYDVPVAGVMKPDITFFGEGLPDEFGKRLVEHDRDRVDLVLVIGTSLKVAPVSEVINLVPKETPQIYISREPCSHVDFDIDLLGDCDTVVTELCKRVGWELKHEMIPPDSKVEVRLREGYESRYDIKRAA